MLKVMLKICTCAVALVSLLPGVVAALDIVLPDLEATLKEGRVSVLGSADSATTGKAVTDGKETPFKIKDGRFFVAIDLKPGNHKVTFVVGNEKVEANWKIEPRDKIATYVYHEGVTEGECDSCHVTADELDEGDDLSSICYNCHDKKDEERYVHGPVAIGMCAACHSPHGSKEKAMLMMSAADLCIDCHNQPLTKIHRGDDVEEKCLSCHNAHTSKQQYLVK
jgi:predicted CXXCH cytochrome family protein